MATGDDEPTQTFGDEDETLSIDAEGFLKPSDPGMSSGRQAAGKVGRGTWFYVVHDCSGLLRLHCIVVCIL